MLPNRIYFGDNLTILRTLPAESVELIYIDPPFNTGKTQARTQIKTERNEKGNRTGFAGQRYETIKIGTNAYTDLFDDYLAFLEPRLLEARRLLTPNGSLYFHIDYREVHYSKVLLDGIFGRESFLNEIIWAYDYGARTRKKWPAKHDNILWYAKNPQEYIYNVDDIDRIPYMAPGTHQQQGKNRLPDPKTARHPAAYSARIVQPRRHGDGFLRGQRNHRRGLPGVRAALHLNGRQSPGAGSDAQTLRKRT